MYSSSSWLWSPSELYLSSGLVFTGDFICSASSLDSSWSLKVSLIFRLSSSSPSSRYSYSNVNFSSRFYTSVVSSFSMLTGSGLKAFLMRSSTMLSVSSLILWVSIFNEWAFRSVEGALSTTTGYLIYYSSSFWSSPVVSRVSVKLLIEISWVIFYLVIWLCYFSSILLLSSSDSDG